MLILQIYLSYKCSFYEGQTERLEAAIDSISKG